MMNSFKSRQELFSYFQEYSIQRREEIDEKNSKKPLLKSYVIETYRSTDTTNFSEHNPFEENEDLCQTKQIDEGLFVVHSNKGTPGFIERINDRYWIFYSTEKSTKSDSYISKLVNQSVLLDHLWISGLLFNSYWNNWITTHEPQRFIKMNFEYDDLFLTLKEKQVDSDDDEYELDDDVNFNEKRVSRIGFTEQKEKLHSILPRLQELLPSFHSISLLRFPSLVGSGGNDFYYSGKVTNRSEDFFDHREQIISVCDTYEKITESIENEVWFGVEKNSLNLSGETVQFKGTPISIVFNNPLSINKFTNFIFYTFNKGKGPFRLWGNPIVINEQLIHVYGLDMHLWQELYIEMTPKQFTVVLPEGTCGNTVHRLVTNIQRYLEPDITVFVGNLDYRQITEQEVRGGGGVDDSTD